MLGAVASPRNPAAMIDPTHTSAPAVHKLTASRLAGRRRLAILGLAWLALLPVAARAQDDAAPPPRAPTEARGAEDSAPTAVTPADAPAVRRWETLETESYRGKQDDLVFVTPERGWYANGAGKLYTTADGGDTWRLQHERPGTFFRALGFVDERVGLIGNVGVDYFPGVTDETLLYRTSDGGESWTAVELPEGAVARGGICAIQVLREPFINHGVLDEHVRLIAAGRVGGPAQLLISDDLGETWTASDLRDVGAMILDVHFFDRRHGLLASATDTDVTNSHALVLRTEDGGATWEPVYQSPRPFEITWKFSFPSDETGFVTIQSYDPDPAASARFVARTDDGGRSWRELPLVDDHGVRAFGIGFLDERTGWVGAMPHGFVTTDGGATWTVADDLGRAVNKVRFLRDVDGGVHGWAIGVQVHRLGQ